jgi:ribosomal protein S18 acetylase RimI-like enzyme
MNPNYEIVFFDGQHLPSVRDLTMLHTATLPTSPVALLGDRFMAQFYYKKLPRHNFIFGAVAYVDHQPAGFIVATRDPEGFMGAAMRRYWGALVWTLGLSLLQEPRKRFSAIWEAWQVMRHRVPSPQPDQQKLAGAELLSFGVLPQYRSAQFSRQTGLQISADLLRAMVKKLSLEGASSIRAVVDADNTSAKLFYHAMGWHLEQTTPSGWKVPTVEFLCQL